MTARHQRAGAALATILFAGSAGFALAQQPPVVAPDLPAPKERIPEQIVPESPGGYEPSNGQANGDSDESLTERLGETGGVLPPPDEGAPGIEIPPPEEGTTTPVIPPGQVPPADE